mmetsp:Transcript_46335/g.110311  ORF Transcript_46335/g.110311 Transcript_46335/m.110311 type:complete len:562 (-) Transcript_46335:648-2333(-)
MGCSTSAAKTFVADSQFHRDYQLGAKISQGSISQVRIARGKFELEDLAVKILDMRLKKTDPQQNTPWEGIDSLLIKNAHAEVATWLKIGAHERCVELREVVWEGPWCYFIHEKVDYTFLYGLERFPVLNEVSLAKAFQQGFEALRHLHSLDIVHLAIRPENFFFNGPNLDLKLSGFGTAQRQRYVKALHKSKHTIRTSESQLPFTSPEMLGTGGADAYDNKADVWSMGVIVYLLFFGEYPYKSKDKKFLGGMQHSIQHGSPRPSFEPWTPNSNKDIAISAKGKAFCRDLLHRFPATRPSAEEVLAMDYLSNPEVVADCCPATQTLVPVLCGAIKAGAFGHHLNEEKDNDVDFLLNYYQIQNHGPITPWTKPKTQLSILKATMDSVKARKEAGVGRLRSDGSVSQSTTMSYIPSSMGKRSSAEASSSQGVEPTFSRTLSTTDSVVVRHILDLGDLRAEPSPYSSSDMLNKRRSSAHSGASTHSMSMSGMSPNLSPRASRGVWDNWHPGQRSVDSHLSLPVDSRQSLPVDSRQSLPVVSSQDFDDACSDSDGVIRDCGGYVTV